MTNRTPFITRPDKFLAEGEIDLGAAPGEPSEELLPFVQQLLREAVRTENGEASIGDGRGLSSFSMEVLAAAPRGRLYGQVWAERNGTTVDFLRYQVLDDGAHPVVTGMATSHVMEERAGAARPDD